MLYHSAHIDEHIQNQVAVSGLMWMFVIDAFERLYGALRHKEAHAVEEAPRAISIGHIQAAPVSL